MGKTPPSLSKSGPGKRRTNGHNPTGATCTVKSTYALIIKIQNLRRKKKRRNRLWLPHVPVRHSRLKMDPCSFCCPTTALPLHGERSRSSDPDQMISAALGWFLKDFFKKKKKKVMINAINKFWTRTSLLPSVKTMIFNPISDTILISVRCHGVSMFCFELVLVYNV